MKAISNYIQRIQVMIYFRDDHEADVIQNYVYIFLIVEGLQP